MANHNKQAPCEYCSRPAPAIAEKGEPGVDIDVHVCEACMRLLKSPETALPLIRGHLSIEGRDAGPGFKEQLEKYMSMISTWHRRN